mgnify:CR=1 FL=1
MPSESFVLVDHPRPQVALVTLNRPERMNAMAFDVMVPFRDELVALPVRGKVESLNVSTAAAALVYGILQFRVQS